MKDMTVRELYNWCKVYRHKDAEVYLVKDWEKTDDQGCFTDLYRLRDVLDQLIVLDDGMDFVDRHEVLLDVDEECASINQ